MQGRGVDDALARRLGEEQARGAIEGDAGAAGAVDGHALGSGELWGGEGCSGVGVDDVCIRITANYCTIAIEGGHNWLIRRTTAVVTIQSDARAATVIVECNLIFDGGIITNVSSCNRHTR